MHTLPENNEDERWTKVCVMGGMWIEEEEIKKPKSKLGLTDKNKNKVGLPFPPFFGCHAALA